jgi:hypothetical protein
MKQSTLFLSKQASARAWLCAQPGVMASPSRHREMKIPQQSLRRPEESCHRVWRAKIELIKLHAYCSGFLLPPSRIALRGEVHQRTYRYSMENREFAIIVGEGIRFACG